MGQQEYERGKGKLRKFVVAGLCVSIKKINIFRLKQEYYTIVHTGMAAVETFSKMKIITWNCNMAFRKKAVHIMEHEPDILVIPECEHPDKLIFPDNAPRPTDILWFGKNKNKGLGIFSYNGYRCKRLDAHNENLQIIVPITVKKRTKTFTLFAIWANNPEDEDGQYVEQIWKALHCYEDLLSDKKVILTGDFNSNTIWDRPRRKGNHSHVVEFLEKKGISSAYHSFFTQVQGKETHPTLYMYRQFEKPYHIDYCFASSYFTKKIAAVEIGDHGNWCKHSDHVPVMVTFNGS